MIDEVRRVSTQVAREEVIAEAESRHQHAAQDMARASMEHVQNVSARVASDVRTETLAEAESRHHQILRETVEQANRIHAQSLDDVRSQAHSRDPPVVLELQNQIAQLTRLNQDLMERLQTAESRGSLRALPAEGGQVGSDNGSNVEMFDLFGHEPVQPPSQSNESINQVLAVLQEEVQNLRDEVSKKKKGKGKKQSSNSSSCDGSSSSESDPEYANERKLMRLKGYDRIKIPQLPKNAAEMRGWKNTVISQLVACCRSNEAELLNWLSGPLEGREESTDLFPVLNRVLGTKLLEASKGGRFGVDFQAMQERSVRQGKQVQGHILLSRICKKFRLDKERGMSLSQQHLLALKPQGVEIKDLEVFRDRVEFVLSSLETSEYPNEAILRSWLYESLKAVPKLALKIERFREAPAGGEIRTFQWSWQSMIDCIDESQHDHNTASILNALKSKVDAAAAGVEKEKTRKRSPSRPVRRKVLMSQLPRLRRPRPRQRPLRSPNHFHQAKLREKGGARIRKTLLPVKRVVHASFTQVALVGGIHVRSFMIQPQSLSRRPSPKLVQVSLPHLQSLQETCHQQKL